MTVSRSSTHSSPANRRASHRRDAFEGYEDDIENHDDDDGDLNDFTAPASGRGRTSASVEVYNTAAEIFSVGENLYEQVCMYV